MECWNLGRHGCLRTHPANLDAGHPCRHDEAHHFHSLWARVMNHFVVNVCFDWVLWCATCRSRRRFQFVKRATLSCIIFCLVLAERSSLSRTALTVWGQSPSQ